MSAPYPGQVPGGKRRSTVSNTPADRTGGRGDASLAFEVTYLATGLDNRDHHGQRAFADANITCGAWRFRGFVHADGSVSLPTSLHDDTLRQAIADELRRLTLERLGSAWARVEELEHQRLAKRGKAA